MRVTFATYPSIHHALKEKCELHYQTISEPLETLTKAYLNNEIGDLTKLKSYLAKVKDPTVEERKTSKISFVIEDELYRRLKEHLAEISNTRPASFFTFIICYYLASSTKREDYRVTAETLMETVEKEITAIVYGLKFYRPSGSGKKMVLEHTTYFIDKCDAKRFWEYYQEPKSPFVEVLAVYRSGGNESGRK